MNLAEKKAPSQLNFPFGSPKKKNNKNDIEQSERKRKKEMLNLLIQLINAKEFNSNFSIQK